ncbi:hypothetical protein LOTGIDRAFT_173993 [Lottia gigantea]|uniref:Uncharacterized protein n=1 Tax=Lottia gigantea TaxID=225164 RepID=V4AVI6_LOTGI|nr:hypothetical protein LOTGIDRAFT_173993 [Lottia gigantea]ESO99065.1 hypothetical protein LOTGIDRAFT_173993 [Lottia gigantea]
MLEFYSYNHGMDVDYGDCDVFNPGQSIVRPIAFKPINTNKTTGKQISPPQQGNRRLSNQDEAIRSQEYHMTNSRPRNLSRGSHHGSDKSGSASFSSDLSQTIGRPESLPSLNHSRLSSNNNMESYLTTPSPSDSGVGELELMLREKDAELNTLRDVMDKNERAIFQVYEEKKNAWLKEIREMKEDYDRKLKIHQRKSYKTEQVLSLQVYKLQQEKEELTSNMNKMACEKEVLRQQCASFEDEMKTLRLKLNNKSTTSSPERSSDDSVNHLRQKVKDLSEEVAEKNREVMMLRSHLHGSENELHKKNTELSNKFKEIVCKTEEVKALKNELGRLSAGEPGFREMDTQTDDTDGVIPLALLKPSLLTEKNKVMSSLQNEVAKVKEQLDDSHGTFEKEREQWLDEKNKVIRYQKQLQLNYVQMYRKNRMLEAEVEQLTLELENRDLKLMALNGGEESVC